ncbi:MAG: photosystem II reaction center protein Psb28 [Xenococcaceae cyanobacterium]
MSSHIPSIEFFKGISEELSDVSLRRNKNTGIRNVLMTFNSLKAIDKFNSFTKSSTGNMLLTDSEGEISVAPSSVKIIFGGDEGDELKKVKCAFEIDREDHWERFMRFMHRYAEANGMEYGSKD